MDISRREAYRILEISDGSSPDEIRAAYKRQALKWHPDKHKNSPEATKRFQEISSAYERLTKPEYVEINLTMEEMFDIFAHVFCGHRGYGGFSDSDEDSGSSDDFQFRPEAFRSGGYEKWEKSREHEIPQSSRPTFNEAQKHAEELLKEEEKLKKQKEKRKERKKRRKARKRQEKEVRYGGREGKKKGKKTVVPESSDDEDDEDEEGEDSTENKENIETNGSTGSSKLNSHNDTSSMHNTNNATSTDKQTIADSNSILHEDTNSSHRKEIHDGHQGGNGENIGAGGGKATENAKKSSKNKKAASIQNQAMSESESNEEVEGLDMNSAFFARAASGKVKKQTTPPPKKEKKKKGRKDESESIEDMDPQILESRKLAVRGNEMANKGNYQAAVKFFSKAIELNPKDFRFFGNRSFCFDHLQMYEEALKDAEEAINLDRTWAKGYYRKGRALSGLKLFSSAEVAFEHVLKLDKDCAEAVLELRTVRVIRLREMGFSEQQSEEAIIEFGSFQAALEHLLARGDRRENSEMEEVYQSDDEDYITQTIQESKLDARNPENLRSLWIGNLQQTVTDKELKELFKPYGEVVSMRRMLEKFCAFVNYKEPRMASRAMEKLQGKEFHGKFLLIKFPDNPIEHHPALGTTQEVVDARFKPVILRKNQPAPGKPKVKPTFIPQDQKAKKSGPVNGNECYFWRTTGCWYGSSCRYEHLPQSAGVDKK
ncbi:uncharacterized protein [Diadema antillarum]|uniref:uncharacterized protein n=2 Tax=Diadema antillarum TaxID=105358 RepID=UPI003A862690